MTVTLGLCGFGLLVGAGTLAGVEEERAEDLGEVSLEAAFADLVHHLHQARVGGGEAFLFGRGEGQRAGGGEELRLPGVGEAQGVGGEADLRHAALEQRELGGELAVAKARVEGQHDEGAGQRHAAEPDLVDLPVGAEGGAGVEVAARSEARRQRPGVAELGASIMQLKRGPAGQAVAGGEVEEGLQFGPGDADLAAGARRQAARVVGAQDALDPREACRRKLAGGRHQGRGAHSLEDQRNEGHDGQQGAGHEPGKEAEHGRENAVRFGARAANGGARRLPGAFSLRAVQTPCLRLAWMKPSRSPSSTAWVLPTS